MRSSLGFSAPHTGSSASKFYLRSVLASAHPTTGEKSLALPVGTFTDGLPLDYSLLPTIGTSETNETVKENIHTHADMFNGRFSSLPVSGGTYGAGTWTAVVQATESNSGGNMRLIPVVYFWRPSTNAVVGYVIDSDAHGTQEFGNGNANARYGIVQTFTGSDVTVLNGDILVFEVWVGGIPDSHTHNTTYKVYFNGTTEPTAGSSEASSASYLTPPSPIRMYA